MGQALNVFKLLMLVSAMFSLPLTAQTIQGTILGNVSDNSGGLLPGVEVEVRNQQTNFVRRTISNDAGFYLVDRLDPGTYEIKARLTGFKEFARPNVRLESTASVRVSITLEIGQISDKVVVEEPSPVIQTESGNIATVIDEHLLLHQPTVNRAPFMQMMFAPGGVWHGGGYSIIGSRGSSGSFTIDGMSRNDVSQGRENSEMWIDPEASKEQRLSYVNNQAEFGKMVVANQTVKTGTNKFHGGANWLHTQGILWAKPPLMRLGQVTKAPTGSKGVQNRFGADIGGPVILPGYNGRDRTFFYFRYDGWRLPGIANYQQNIATEAMQAGDFSTFTTPLIDPLTGNAFPGNRIPMNRLNATALKYLEQMKYPRPNFGNPAVPVANLVGSFVSGRNDFWVVSRVDHTIANNQNLSYHFIRRKANFVRWDSGYPWIPGFILRINDNFSHVLAHTWSMSPKSVNELRLGFQRQNSPDGSHLIGKDLVDAVGLTGYPEPLEPGVDGVPGVSFAGLTGITTERPRNVNIQNEWEINDIFSFLKGDHHFKTGINFLHSYWSRFPVSPSSQFGSFTFDGSVTGQSFADFLLGIARTASRSSAISPYYGRRNSSAVFFQDDWKIRTDFTLNLGLRYEFFSPFKEEQNRIHSFDPFSGSIVVPDEQTIAKIHPLFPKAIPVITADSAGLPDTLIESDGNNIAPRVGFAWRSNLWDLVVRAGYGFYYNGEAKKGFAAMVAGPFTATETFDNSIVGGQPLFVWPQVFPQSGAARPLGVQSVNATAAHLRDSYTQQWNLTLEKQVGENGIRISHIGHSSMQLPFRRNLNQPFPSTTPFSQSLRPFPLLQNITLFESGATQSYNAFQIQWDRRFVRGFSLNSHYTWSKNLTDSDDSGGVQGTVIENAYDRRSERGNALVGPRHSWRTQYVFDLPFGRGRRYMASVPAVVEVFLGGWSTSGIVGFNTGMYSTPRFSGRDISNTNTTGGRPDRACNGRPSTGKSFAQWFDVSCFTVPALGIGRFGNTGKGIIQGPSNGNWNVRVFKYFMVREYLKIRFDAQFENVLDHATWDFVPGDDGLNVSSAGGGLVTRAFSWGGSFIEVQRMVHFQLKLEF